MKLAHYFLLIALPVMTIISCGTDYEDNNSSRRDNQQEKDLFSRWTNTDAIIIDLSDGHFNTPFTMRVFYPDGASCNCAVKMTGTQNSGEADFSSCMCAEIDHTAVPATFTKDESELRICDPVCEFFR